MRTGDSPRHILVVSSRSSASPTGAIFARVNGGIARVNGGFVLAVFYERGGSNAGICDQVKVENVAKVPNAILINRRLVCKTENSPRQLGSLGGDHDGSPIAPLSQGKAWDWSMVTGDKEVQFASL